MTGEELARAARALSGSRFRLHGRDPATGLDCIGVFAAALAASGRPVDLPSGYTLRNRSLPDMAALADRCGFLSVDGDISPGDVLMTCIPPCQFHLLVAVARNRFVHAHAGLGRVTMFDGPLDWPVVGHWRPVSVT